MQNGVKSEARVLVVGAGCVGVYLACKLSKIGVRVVLKGRGVESKAGTVSTFQSGVSALCEEANVERISSFKQLAECEFDFLFLATKTYDYAPLAEELSAHKVSGRVMVAVHNGVVIYPFKHEPVVPVVVPQSYDITPCTQSPCGTTMVVRNEEKPWILPDIPAARKAVSILRQAGVHAEASLGFEVLLLRKFAINCVANLLSIVVDTNCEGLCSNHWDRMQDLYKEFMTIVEQTHPNGCRELPDNFNAIVFNGLASYGKHFPSSKHDFNAGKPIEIGSLNGYLVHCGKELNIPVPHNSSLVREVEAMVVQRDQKHNEKSI